MIKLLGESTIGSGVPRVEALVGADSDVRRRCKGRLDSEQPISLRVTARLWIYTQPVRSFAQRYPRAERSVCCNNRVDLVVISA